MTNTDTDHDAEPDDHDIEQSLRFGYDPEQEPDFDTREEHRGER